MSAILIDNWSLERLQSNEMERESYDFFLEAIVLWDFIYYVDSQNSTWWKSISGEGSLNFLECIADDEIELKDKAKEIYYSILGHDKYTDLVGCHAIRYMLLSDRYGMSYFPCKERSAFLKEKFCTGARENLINRLEMMEAFDREVLRYYNEFNNFVGKNIIKFPTPVLADYIRQNAGNGKKPIEYALELRKKRSVIAFRNYLTEIEAAINEGHWKVLMRFKQDISEIVEQIFRDTGICDVCTVEILPMPTLNIKFEAKSIKRFMQLNFLRTLGRFAYNGRKMEWRSNGIRGLDST